MTNTIRVDVRLLAHERSLIDELAASLSTPLRPKVSTSDVLRAGLVALAERLAIAPPRGA